MESKSSKQSLPLHGDQSLTSSEKLAVKYHDIFNYPLTSQELFKWSKKSKLRNNKDYFYLKGRKKIVKQRIQNEKYSKVKLKIAKKASLVLSKIPTVKFVGITGALAMNNANKNSDIDLMIITKSNYLWTTRVWVYFLLLIAGFKVRSPKQNDEKDKLCINLWLDQNDLGWNKKDRNIYTAHEIAQIVPLINKDNTYENFLHLNKWILGYWPNAVETKKPATISTKRAKRSFLEMALFNLQFLYMKSKITREVVTPTKAIFHPNDWGKSIINKLST